MGHGRPSGRRSWVEVSFKDPPVRYGITDNPPWWMCILLGMQTFLTMLGASVLIPSILVPAMGGTTKDLARVINTCFMASGINTLIQTQLGARLPIVQGGSFAYLSPVLTIAAGIQNTMSFASDHDRFLYTMRVLQGGIIGSALIALGLALLGIFYWLLQHLSPITIGVNISILGLSLYNSGWPAMGTCIQLGMPAMALIILFGFHMRRVQICGLAVFGLFPVILGIGVTWLYAYIFTVAGVYDSASPETQKACTTSQSNFNYILSEAPWFRVPYPGQWGSPIFTTSGVLTLVAAVIPAALESIGDYYAAARLAGAPQPPGEVVSRALAMEAACCAIAGVFGTTSGSTAYAENVGAISITGVASRRVTQAGALIMILVSVVGKIGALFASIPQALVAGVFTVMFSIIAGVGFSNLQGVNLQSHRNILILGFGLYCGLSVPAYFESYTAANGHGPVDTGSGTFNDIANAIFSTPAAVSLMACLLLDLTIPMLEGERGRQAWQVQQHGGRNWWQDPEMEKLYGWPFGLTPKWRRIIDPVKQAGWNALAAAAARLDCRRCGRRERQRPPLADVELPQSVQPPSTAPSQLDKSSSEDP